LFPVGVDTCKEQLVSALLQEEPGPNYCHFPLDDSYDQEFFEQLTAERRVIRYQNGRPKFVWVKKRARNEAMDNRNYARAALEITGADLDALAIVGGFTAAPQVPGAGNVRRQRSKGVQR
jgi:phage terminase large subunit GpA-like protein